MADRHINSEYVIVLEFNHKIQRKFHKITLPFNGVAQNCSRNTEHKYFFKDKLALMLSDSEFEIENKKIDIKLKNIKMYRNIN